ncbi:UNVERIFIED_CONTAM: hypothetical protein Scaly_1502300 [Sesamum calycinum]|uniref:MULE transposase domain-containing protein n=1 Tax=Sesamum calycinum TaxID=2727403 RepID=A0AAW2PU08_9LAMI
MSSELLSYRELSRMEPPSSSDIPIAPQSNLIVSSSIDIIVYSKESSRRPIPIKERNRVRRYRYDAVRGGEGEGGETTRGGEGDVANAVRYGKGNREVERGAAGDASFNSEFTLDEDIIGSGDDVESEYENEEDDGKAVFNASGKYDPNFEIGMIFSSKSDFKDVVAKRKAINTINGAADDQFSLIWDYAEELRKRNPMSNVIMMTIDSDYGNVNKNFAIFYVMFDALRVGFLSGCRPIIGVDGCHLKGPHGGVLLTAVSIDPNNNLYHLAYAIVSGETRKAREWFLGLLKSDLNMVWHINLHYGMLSGLLQNLNLSQVLDPEDFVNPCYSVQTFKRVYRYAIMPVNGPKLWAQTGNIPPLPSNFGRKTGRLSRARRIEPDEIPNNQRRNSKTGQKKPIKLKRQSFKVKCHYCGGKEKDHFNSCIAKSRVYIFFASLDLNKEVSYCCSTILPIIFVVLSSFDRLENPCPLVRGSLLQSANFPSVLAAVGVCLAVFLLRLKPIRALNIGGFLPVILSFLSGQLQHFPASRW